MKRFLLSKRALQRVIIAVCAVIFLFLINYFLSNNSLFKNLFSREKIFVETIDVGERDSLSAKKNIQPKTTQLASIRKAVQKTRKEIVVDSETKANVPTETVPHLYVQEIQTGDTKSARNEFVKICNYGQDILMDGVSLKKKTSSGTEEGLLGDQWSNITVSSTTCIYAANVEADISVDPIIRWAKSHSLAEKNNTLLLYYKNQLIDEVFWNVIPKGESIIRESPTSSWHIKK